MKNLYAAMAAQFGEVTFEGKTYALTSQAAPTNRLFCGCFSDASEGEQYTAEYSAPAMDADENELVVTWQFDVIRGQEPDDDCLNWENVHSVVFA